MCMGCVSTISFQRMYFFVIPRCIVLCHSIKTHLIISTVRSKIKKIEIAMINTLQLAARKNLIQMSLQW
jgi:hypothetical protein